MNVAHIRNTLKFQVVGWLVPVHESVHGLPDPSFSMHVSVCLSFFYSLPSFHTVSKTKVPGAGYVLYLLLSSENCFYQQNIILLSS